MKQIYEMRWAGHSTRAIARELGLARNTVLRYLKSPEAIRPKPRSRRGSKLDPYTEHIDRRLGDGLENCVVLLRELRDLGYDGSNTILSEYVRPRRMGEPSGDGEEASSQGLGGYQLLAQTDARCPACQVVGHHLYCQPGGVGGEAARGEMVEPDAVLQVSDGILDLGMAAVVGLQFQGFTVPVGDEAVIAVAGEEGQLRT